MSDNFYVGIVTPVVHYTMGGLSMTTDSAVADQVCSTTFVLNIGIERLSLIACRTATLSLVFSLPVRSWEVSMVSTALVVALFLTVLSLAASVALLSLPTS